MPVSSPALTLMGPSLGRKTCDAHSLIERDCEFIAITGGPGAGKTAVLNVAQNLLCKHVVFVPEAATIIFSGGFWRAQTVAGLAATQTAIFHVQRQLESFARTEGQARFALCDRGTVDCFAYWPQDREDMWTALDVDREVELKRYKAVIHLRTPSLSDGYNHSNNVRTETAERAAEIDDRILTAWNGHPNRTIIDSRRSFEEKISLVLEAIQKQLIF